MKRTSNLRSFLELAIATAFGAAMLVSACSKGDASAPAAEEPAATAVATAATPDVLPTAQASADPLGALSLPDMRSCLSKCTGDNRARGVGADQVETDCRSQCEQSCLSQCDEASEPQKSRCKQDCGRQNEAAKLP